MDVSVIIPAYNAEDHVEGALASVFAQSADFDFEVIVVDDGSTDRTSDLVLSRFPKARLLRKPNGGPGSARNLGVRQAAANIVLFLDADDIMLEGRLALQAGFMQRTPEAAISFGRVLYSGDCTAEAARRHSVPPCVPRRLDRPYFLLLRNGCIVAATTTALRRDVYLEMGGQREDAPISEDYDLYLRLARAGLSFFEFDESFSWYRRGHSNLTSTSHGYIGPVRAIHDHLAENHDDMQADHRHAARLLLQRKLRSLLGWLWVERGNRAAREGLGQYGKFCSVSFRAGWSLILLLPQRLARWTRSAKRLARPRPW